MSEPSAVVLRARAFAEGAHMNQARKYTGEPYFNHVHNVAKIVREVPTCTPEMIAAAYLHDVVEDTPTTLEMVQEGFGTEVALLVYWLTDQSKPSDGNRAKRKAIDRDHLARAPADAQTIKLADLIDNTSSIVLHDPDFAKVYMREKQQLLEVLTKGDPVLMQRARAQITT